jgi:lysophospholipase L1-like esterase
MDEVRRYQSDWDLALAHLKEWAQQREVPVIDMTALGAAHSVAELYFDGIHLRPAGDRLFAQGFVDWFLANPPPRRF